MNEEKNKIDFADRRRFPRFLVHYLADVCLKDETICATVIDISENGVGIMLPERFDIDEKINIELRPSLSDTNAEKIRVTAKVIWVGKKNEKGMHTCGLEITEISEKDLENLRNHIQTLCDFS